MNIIPWRSSSDVATLRKEMEDFFSRFFEGDGVGRHLPEVFHGAGHPRVNVAETETAVEITAELPGMDEKDIEVQLMGTHLVISGERKWKEEHKTKEYHRMESEYGRFRREIPLPDGLRMNADDITATYRKGVLTISVPKLEPTPASRITVKAE